MKELISRSSPMFILIIGFLGACLTPTRGHFDLNYLPSLGLASALGIAGCVAVVAALRRDRACRIPWEPVAALAWLAACVVATFLRGSNGYPDGLLLVIGYLAALGVAVWLASAVPDEGTLADSDGWLLGAAWFAALATGYAVFVQAGFITVLTEWVIKPPREVTPFGNFYQRNLAALIMVIGVAVASLWPDSRRRFRALRFGTVMVLVLAISLTRSRAGVGLLCLVAGYAAAVYFQRKTASGVRPWFATILVACVGGVLALVIQATLQHLLTATLLTTQPPSDGLARLAEGDGLAMRLQIMKHGLEQWMEHPWAGGGWGSHAGWLFDHATQLTWPRYSTNTHNLVTQLLAEVGVVGALPLIGILVLSAWGIVRTKSSDRSRFWHVHLAVTGVLLVHSMVEYPLWNLEFALLFFWSWTRLAGLSKRAGLSLTQGAVASVGLASAVLACGALWYVVAITRVVDARHQIVAGTAEPVALASRIRTFGLSHFADILLYARLPLSSENIAQKLALGERVIHFAPEWWLIERQAILATVDGQVQRAADLYLKACAMHASRCDEMLARLDQLVDTSGGAFERVRAQVSSGLPLLPKGEYDLPLLPALR